MKLKKLFLFFMLFPCWGLAQTASMLKEKAIPVLMEKNKSVLIAHGGFVPQQKIIFVRLQPDYDEFEIIGQGFVKSSNSKNSLVELSAEKLQKLPKRGDFAVMMAEPKTFVSKKAESKVIITQVEDSAEKNLEKGYLEFGFTNWMGNLKSTSSNSANSYKNFNNYKFSGVHFEWFVDFLPNYGLTFDNVKGGIPIYSYYLQDVSSTYSFSRLKINYRNKSGPGQWRWKFYLMTQVEQFQTSNPDEYVLASQSSFVGLGGVVGYDFSDQLINDTRWWGKPLGLYVESSLCPQVSVADISLSRGTATAGSSRTEISAQYSHIFYLSKIPWIKRYVLDLKYTVTDMKLNFQGKTQSESGGIYTIPEGGNYREVNQFISLTLNFRFEDLIGRSLKPRN